SHTLHVCSLLFLFSLPFSLPFCIFFFFFNDTAPTEIYTLSLHDALPIYLDRLPNALSAVGRTRQRPIVDIGSARVRGACRLREIDRKSTRLNSSHVKISYAVFCLKKKKKITVNRPDAVHIPRDYPTSIRL